MKKVEEYIHQKIYGLIPVYQPAIGNGTKIILEDGTSCIDTRTVRTILKILCKYYAIHIEHAREKYGKLIHQRLGVPLPIYKGLLLIPLKVRKPIIEKDGACGYINLYGISDLKEEKGYTWIQLKNGIQIQCFHRAKTVYQHINHAKLIAEHAYGSEKGEHLGEILREWGQTYDCPATKGDILLLKDEMMRLIHILQQVVGTKNGN